MQYLTLCNVFIIFCNSVIYKTDNGLGAELWLIKWHDLFIFYLYCKIQTLCFGFHKGYEWTLYSLGCVCISGLHLESLVTPGSQEYMACQKHYMVISCKDNDH